MKTFAEFKNSIQLEEKPIYTRREGEAGYDLVDDNVFKPLIGKGESKEEFREKLKILRNAGLPKGTWKGIK